jgi:hypothetical protein
MKVVINSCYGGFDLSHEAEMYYAKLKGIDEGTYWSIERNDPFLVQVVEKLGRKANTEYSYLKVVEIPDDVEWEIEEHGGKEWIAEEHRIWD